MVKWSISVLAIFMVSLDQGASTLAEEFFVKLKNHDIESASNILDELAASKQNEVAFWLQVQLELYVSGEASRVVDFDNQATIDSDKTAFVVRLVTEGDLIVHNELGKDDLVFEKYQQALEFTEHSKVLRCEVLKRILVIVSQNSHLLNQYPVFLKLYEKAVYDEYERANFNLLRIKYESAISGEPMIENFKMALDSVKDFELLRAKYYRMIGIAYDYYQKQYDSAKVYHQKSKKLYDLYDSFHAFDRGYATKINLAIVMNQTEEYIESNRMLIPLTKSIIKKNKEYNKALAYSWLAKNYEKLSMYDSSNYFLKKRNNLKDSLDFLKNASNVAYLQTKFETEKKEKQILEEQQKSRTTRNWLIAAGLALIFGTGIAILLQKNTTKKRLLAEQEALLKQERVDNLLKAQELVSIDAMIAGQEKERQRVANELHDDLGSLMATIKLHFDNANISKKDPALQNAQKLLGEAYQKVRGMAHSKNSGVMSDQGLLPAIKKMAQIISETNALKVTVEDFGMGERLENSLELNLFRMVQELVANAIKHAEATKVGIQLTQHEDNLNIIIEDDGKGFDRSKVNSDQTGMGLTTIEKRVEHLEGNFTVDSVLGKGTSILIDIPV